MNASPSSVSRSLITRGDCASHATPAVRVPFARSSPSSRLQAIERRTRSKGRIPRFERATS